MDYFDNGVFFTRHADSGRVLRLAVQLSERFARGEICEDRRPRSLETSAARSQCCQRLAAMLRTSLRESYFPGHSWKSRFSALAECMIAYAACYEALELWSRFYPGYLNKVLESADVEHQGIVRRQQTMVEAPRAKQFLLAFQLGLSHVCYAYESRAFVITPPSPEVLERQEIERVPALLREIAFSHDVHSRFSDSARRLMAHGSSLLFLSENFELPESHTNN